MGTTLNKNNLSNVLSSIEKKGFRTKFWREYRSSAAKGQGVAKHLDALEKMGVGVDGKPDKADLDQMPEIVQTFSGLSNAMLKAGGKCGKLQSETKAMCEKYRKIIAIREAAATKMAQNADKIKQAKMARQLKFEKANQETDKILDQYKKDNNARLAIVSKEIKSVGQRAQKLLEAAETAKKEIAKANTDVAKLLSAFKSKHDKEGTDNRDLEAKVIKGLEEVYKKNNIEMHAKNVKGPFPKLLKEVTDTFKQFNAVDGIKKERMSAGKAVAAARSEFIVVQDDVKFFLTQYKIATDTVATARKEGT